MARESFEWYPATGARHIASGGRLDGRAEPGARHLRPTADTKKLDTEGMLDLISYEYIRDSGSAVVGDPDQCVKAAKVYEEVGVDLLSVS